jgi:hypothetical protein
LPCCYFVQVLSLPPGVSRSKVSIPRARCHSLLFLIFRLELYESIQNSSYNKV